MAQKSTIWPTRQCAASCVIHLPAVPLLSGRVIGSVFVRAGPPSSLAVVLPLRAPAAARRPPSGRVRLAVSSGERGRMTQSGVSPSITRRAASAGRRVCGTGGSDAVATSSDATDPRRPRASISRVTAQSVTIAAAR